MKKTCDFSGFTFTGTDGKTYGYDEKGAPCTNPNKPIDTQLTNIGNTGNPFTNWGPSGSFGNSTNTSTIPTFNLPNMNIPTNIPLSNDSMSGIKQIGDLHNHAHNLSEFIAQYENEPWEKVVKKERVFGLKPFTIKKESHVKPHALQVEQAKIELKTVQEQIANLSIDISTSQKTSLDYSNRGFSAEDVKNVKAQEGCYELVSFKNNNISCEGLKHLIYSEEGQKAITNGSSDLKEIYQGMLAKQGVMIVNLDLSNCNIGGLGADKLGQAIYGSKLNALQHLNLSNNNITDDGIYAFGNAWFCNTSPSLRTLNLSNNKLTDNGANSLSWSLKNNNLYNLKKLDISGNNITNDGDTKLMEAAKGLWNDFAIFTHKLDEIVKMDEGTKEEKIAIYKAIVEKGKALGTYDKAMVVDKSWWGKISHSIDKLEFKGKWLFGFGKCHVVPDPKEEVTSYAQDKIIATLPAKTATGLGIAKKGVGVLTKHYDFVTCFISTTDAIWSSELGQQIAKHELCLLGEQDFCHGEQ